MWLLSIKQALREAQEWLLYAYAHAQAVSTFISACGLVIAAIGLLVNACQTRMTRKAGTLRNLLDILHEKNEREAALRDAKDNRELMLDAFVELLNFLEVCSVGIQKKLFSGPDGKIVCEIVVDTIAAIERNPVWHEEMKNARTSPTTYEHLFRFIDEHRFMIDEHKRYLDSRGGLQLAIDQ